MQLNEFGNITKTTQGSLTEYRYFDTYQRLCQSCRVDTGKTVGENGIDECMGGDDIFVEVDTVTLPTTHE